MRTWRWSRVSVAGLSLAAMASFRLGDAGRAISPRPAASAAVTARTVPGTPSARARREAMSAWWRAQNAVNSERQSLEDWDPAVRAPTNQEIWRRRLMASGGNGDLQRATAAAARTQALARTPRELFAASQLAWRITADEGNPEAELAAARLLVRLDRHNPVSLLALRHAALAGDRYQLAREADGALRALRSVMAG